MEGTILIEVYDEDGTLAHNALCRTLHDVAMASQGRSFRLSPPKGEHQSLEWDIEYHSYENQVALAHLE